MIKTIDEFSPIGNNLKIFNNNFSELGNRLCNIDHESGIMRELAPLISSLSGTLNNLSNLITSSSADFISMSNMVYTMKGYWLSPITLVYPDVFNYLGNFEEIENWLNNTFGENHFAKNQLLKISFLVRNYSPSIIEKKPYPLENTNEKQTELATSLGFAVKDIKDYIVYKNHVDSIVNTINNIFQATNNTNYILKNYTEIPNLYNSFRVEGHDIHTNLPIQLSEKNLKLIYSFIQQYETIESVYLNLIDKGINNISPQILSWFETYDVYGTFFHDFCFYLKNGKWTYTPNCNLNYCVDHNCSDCYEPINENELYNAPGCKTRIKIALKECITNKIFVTSIDNIEDYIHTYIEFSINNGPINRYYVDNIDNVVTIGENITYIPSYYITSPITISPIQDCPPCESITDTEIVYALMICNSNKLIDDDFNIYLNGVYIGQAILGENDYVGSVFISSIEHIDLDLSNILCPSNKMVRYYFNPSLLIEGENEIFMENIKNNGNNNYGSIGLIAYKKYQNYLVCPTIIDDIEYSGGSGQDILLTFNFDPNI